MGIIRTRFAPSPTGDLHLGNARTALYNWLYAKQHGGQFILRIEDTDQERSTKQYSDDIITALQWLGLQYDNEPEYQSTRFERYQERIEELYKTGDAYRCYCTRERLERLRIEQLAQKQVIRYDGRCRNKDPLVASDLPFVVRLRTPLEGETHFDDSVLGHICIQNNQLDDLVIARSDGMPTYHFSVVVDDIDTGITHIIRGNDHVNNTPRQLHIFKALKATPPQYSHLPMVLNEDGQRLSKRRGALGILAYRNAGYLPTALCNYLLRLGWAHGDKEYFTAEEMLSCFNLEHLHKSPAQFDTQKLLWFNQHYLKNLSLEHLLAPLKTQLKQLSIDTKQGPPLAEVATLLQQRGKTLKEIASASAYFYKNDIVYNLRAKEKYITKQSLALMQNVLSQLESLERWHVDDIKQVFHRIIEDQKLRFPQLAQPLRIALTGDTASPAIDMTVYLIGKKRVLQRLRHFLQQYPGSSQI